MQQESSNMDLLDVETSLGGIHNPRQGTGDCGHHTKG